MDSKRGEDLTENTLYMLYKHTLALNRLRDFSAFRSMAIYSRPSMLTETDFEPLMADSARTAKLA